MTRLQRIGLVSVVATWSQACGGVVGEPDLDTAGGSLRAAPPGDPPPDSDAPATPSRGGVRPPPAPAPAPSPAPATPKVDNGAVTAPPSTNGVPNFADLQVDGDTFVYPPAHKVYVFVINRGNMPTTGIPTAPVIVGGRETFGTLRHATVSPTPYNTLNPGDRGIIEVSDVTYMSECGAYEVQIDPDHTWQREDRAMGVFDNDDQVVKTACPLYWDTEITTERLGEVPDILIAGKTLASIVSSFDYGRLNELGDGPGYCSDCHYQNAVKDGNGYDVTKYKPNWPQGTKQYVTETRIFYGTGTPAGTAWGFSDGWARRFASNSYKPKYLKDAFQKYMDDLDRYYWLELP
jgi:hypothetical protein